MPPAKIRRTSFAQRLIKLAESDISAAMILALRGRDFSTWEKLLNEHYLVLSRVADLKAGKDPIEKRSLAHYWTKEMESAYEGTMPQILDKKRKELADLLLEAIERKDPKPLFAIGKAVNSLNKFKPSGDKYRLKILGLKRICDEQGVKISLKLLALLIDWPPSNEMWPLRRMAKAVNFPLTRTTKIHIE
jgi:hypothetical protein